MNSKKKKSNNKIIDILGCELKELESKFSLDGALTYNHLDKNFKKSLEESIGRLNGSIYYLQKGSYNFKLDEDKAKS